MLEELKMKKFRWCFIGTGKLATRVAKEIIGSGRHEIVSCYTRNYDKCVKFAEEYNATPCREALEAIQREDVDGVYIVTPHNAHYRYAKMALEAKKPVLCEKAFTVTALEAEELVALAKENNTYLAEAMWTWFSPCANEVKKWIDDKEIGNISGADFSYHMKSINYAPRVGDPKRAGGALLDITVYPIHYAYRLFGYPEKIESSGVIENGIDISEEIKMTFKNNLLVNISASIVDMKGLENMKISGDKGTIKSFFYHASNSATLNKGFLKKTKYKCGKGPVHGYIDEFDTVAKEIASGLKESKMVPLKATLDVMHIMDEIREQIGLHYTELE